MARKIRPGKVAKRSSKIRAGSVPEPSPISFSFQYLDSSNPKFDYSDRESGYFCKVLQRLSALCTKTRREISVDRTSALRAHPIDWAGTTEPKGFSHLDEQLQESMPYQFSISANEHGRVHGFFIDSVFYVVWFDPRHELYR